MLFKSTIWFFSLFLILACSSNKKVSQDLSSEFRIEHLISGSAGHNSITMAIKTSEKGKLSLNIFELNNTKKSQTINLNFTTNNNYNLKQEIRNLKENTTYAYTLTNENGSLLAKGNFNTMPTQPTSYKIVFGSCAETGSESEIFTKIKNENPLFYLQIGDLHYENIGDNCKERFEFAFQKVFRSKTQSELYKHIPLAYMWDDHDYGPNNSDSTNPCRKEAIANYKNNIPHYPLQFDTETGPISQTFSAGRVLFLLSDLRSQKVSPEYKECERIKIGTNFGDEAHLTWFFETLLKAKAEGKVVAWVSSYPWINAPGGPNYKCKERDNWGGYPEERETIANFIRDNQIPVLILSGDAHMVAIDDGTNSDYATNGGAPIAVFQAAALDRLGSYKGGPYSHGYSATRGQYGVIEVEDNGGENVCFKWYARDDMGGFVRNEKGEEIRLNFCLTVAK